METAFASDNYAPVHPKVMAALADANEGYARAYGADAWTELLDERVEEIFGWGSLAYPVLNGTGANVVSLMATTPRWGAVVAAEIAHINVDENGAPERVGGLKLLTHPGGPEGKLTVADIESWSPDLGNVHRAQPGVVSVTQATEVGTVYRPGELRELSDAAHELGMAVHMDGARLANAAAYLGCGLRDLVTEVGVDLLSLGAAKNGGMFGEAVVVLGAGDAQTTKSAELRRAAAEAVPYLRKTSMQLASKTRYISAQLLALLGQPARISGGRLPISQRLWLKNAKHANEMAQRLRAGVENLSSPEIDSPSGTIPSEIRDDAVNNDAVNNSVTQSRDDAVNKDAANNSVTQLPDDTAASKPAGQKFTGVRVSRPTESNAVFATLPRVAADKLREQFFFYDWGDGETPDRVEARWMCSWATTPGEVDQFLVALSAALSAAL